MSREATVGLPFEAVRTRHSFPDAGHVIIAVAAASFATLGMTSGIPAPVALANAVVMTAVAAIALALMDRIELALWGLVPLLAVVRWEPAPVDFMVVALFIALVSRGEIVGAAPHPLALVAATLFVTSNLLALVFAVDVGRGVAHAATTVHLMLLAYVSYQLAVRGHEHAERAYIAASLALVVMTIEIGRAHV